MTKTNGALNWALLFLCERRTTMTKNTIIEAALKGLLNNRKQITRTISNIIWTILHAVSDEYLQNAGDRSKR